jgi:hypothetical protein
MHRLLQIFALFSLSNSDDTINFCDLRDSVCRLEYTKYSD